MAQRESQWASDELRFGHLATGLVGLTSDNEVSKTLLPARFIGHPNPGARSANKATEPR
jgi:hypothetical protein